MEKIIFEDLPSTKTPLNSENLNKIQDNVETFIDEVQVNIDKKIDELEININSTSEFLQPTILYESSTGQNSGTIDLNDSVTNYKRIKIFYFDGDGVYSSTEVYDVNGKTISLESLKHGKDGQYAIIIYMQNVTVNNNQVNFLTNGRALVINSNGSIHSAGSMDTETIYRIEGYKY